MATNHNAPVGKTRDTEFQIGARRTYPIALKEAWNLVVSERGQNVWLGRGANISFTQKSGYLLPDQAMGEVRVFKPQSHLRLTWQPPGWDQPSTIQVRVIAVKKDKTTIALHQEHLPGPEEREVRKTVFNQALDRLGKLVEGRPIYD